MLFDQNNIIQYIKKAFIFWQAHVCMYNMYFDVNNNMFGIFNVLINVHFYLAPIV